LFIFSNLNSKYIIVMFFDYLIFTSCFVEALLVKTAG